MQVSAVIQLAVNTIKDCHNAAKKVIIKSDNSSAFASQELIPCVFNLNTRLHDGNIDFYQIDIHRNTDWKNMIGYSLFIYQ